MAKPFIKHGGQKLACTCPQCELGDSWGRVCVKCMTKENQFRPLAKYRGKIQAKENDDAE